MESHISYQKIVTQLPNATTAKHVYRYLFDQIVQNELCPDSAINETTIAKELNVSRSPVRDAINRLEQEGLVIHPKGKSARVLALNLDEYMQISYIRSAIERESAKLAAYLISEAELFQLETILTDMALFQDSKIPFPVNDSRFHEIIINASRNVFLKKAYRIYSAKLFRYRWYIYKNEPKSLTRRQNEFAQHLAIYNALKLHLSDQASNALYEDIELMRRSIQRMGNYPSDIEINK
jgi:DNA-binding GntR family transcriptional regulator